MCRLRSGFWFAQGYTYQFAEGGTILTFVSNLNFHRYLLMRGTTGLVLFYNFKPTYVIYYHTHQTTILVNMSRLLEITYIFTLYVHFPLYSMVSLVRTVL